MTVQDRRPHSTARQIESKSVTITLGEHTFIGNTTTPLLEQIELSGLPIPSSCRSGLCERCRLTLIRGDITLLRPQPINADHTFLACIALPCSDLILAYTSPVRKRSR